MAETQGIGWRGDVEDRKLEKQKEATSRRALDAMGLYFILEAMGNYLMVLSKRHY